MQRQHSIVPAEVRSDSKESTVLYSTAESDPVPVTLRGRGCGNRVISVVARASSALGGEIPALQKSGRETGSCCGANCLRVPGA